MISIMLSLLTLQILQAKYNVISYKHKPRLQTAVEMLHAAQKIEKNLEKVQQLHLVFTVKSIRTLVQVLC